MDLGAYVKIDSFDNILENQSITVPRLRGIRWMGSEVHKITKSEMAEYIKENNIEDAEDILRTNENGGIEYSYRTDKYIKDKIIEKKDEDGYICKVDINFKNIHGKKRKQIKYAMKKNKIEIPMQATLWNKYVGKKDVLYVHARMGYKGSQVEWAEEWNNLINHPDFLGWIPDYIGDSSYCDIYIRIHPENIPDVEASKALMKKAIDDKEWQKAVEIAEYLNDIIKEDDPFHTTLNILLPRLYDELKKVDSFISD